MQNFDFYNPTKIIFGTSTIARLNELIPLNARVLILYGGSSAEKTGTLAEVQAALGARVTQHFAGIEPNPTYETLMKAVAQIKREKLDYLLAVGGGSVLDGTKFIAAAVNFPGDPWDMMQTRGASITQALPFASVLTLPATGSEMNDGAVITRQSIQAKLAFMSPFVFPQFSILDPTKTLTLPPRQVANGIVDSFVHIVEQYLTYPEQAMVQDRFAESLLQILIEIGPQALDKPDDYSVRANLMWVATLALNGLIGAGVPQDWSSHMIGHELTALFGIDHARTLAVVLPSVMQVQKTSKREKLLQYAQRVWHITQGSDDEKIDAAIAQTRTFFERVGISTSLTDYGVKANDIERVIAQLKAHGMTQLGERGDITLEVSQRILENSL